MKGLALAEDYFRFFGSKMMKREFPEYLDRVAVGLVGPGSDCFGFDDALSRDHDWGPGFCLWLEKEDFQAIGPALHRAYLALPASFLGFERSDSPQGLGRVGAMETGAFFASFIGSPQVPSRPIQWLTIPEANLAVCTNGRVFHDPLGRFSAIRNALLQHYPEDIRLKKIAARCMSAARAGQYNHERCIRRNESWAATRALVTFGEDVLALVFLLHRKYMPFFKWSRQAAKALPEPGPSLAGDLVLLMEEKNLKTRIRLIEKTSAALVLELRRQGLSDSFSDFLLDHGPSVQSRIQDEQIRNLDLWWGGM